MSNVSTTALKCADDAKLKSCFSLIQLISKHDCLTRVPNWPFRCLCGTVWCKQISPCSVIRQKQKNSPIVFRLGKLQSKLHCPVLSSSIAWIFSMGATVKEVVCALFGFFFFFPFFLSSLLYSIAVRRITSAKGTIWQSTSQMSIILMSEVGGRPSILLMKMANRHIPTSQKPTMVGFWQ